MLNTIQSNGSHFITPFFPNLTQTRHSSQIRSRTIPQSVLSNLITSPNYHHTAKVRTSTPPSTSSYTSFTNPQTNHAAKKLLFHHRQTKAKKAERSQIIVADTHCAKKDPPTTKKHWIKKYGLTWHHKKILDSGTKWLDGDLINASQKVLAKQFKHKFGGAGFQTIANGLCGNFSRNW